MSDPLDRVREIALQLPGTEERLSHSQPTFFVGGKQFVQFRRQDNHGDGRMAVCVRIANPDEQAMLIEADPATFNRPAYLPSWIGINLGVADVDWDQVADRIAASWELAAPRRLLEAGGR